MAKRRRLPKCCPGCAAAKDLCKTGRLRTTLAGFKATPGVLRVSLPASGQAPPVVYLEDIGQRLGIFQRRSARALGGYSDVSEQTRLRVEEAARLLGYR